MLDSARFEVFFVSYRRGFSGRHSDLPLQSKKVELPLDRKQLADVLSDFRHPSQNIARDLQVMRALERIPVEEVRDAHLVEGYRNWGIDSIEPGDVVWRNWHKVEYLLAHPDAEGEEIARQLCEAFRPAWNLPDKTRDTVFQMLYGS